MEHETLEGLRERKQRKLASVKEQALNEVDRNKEVTKDSKEVLHRDDSQAVGQSEKNKER
ncbi:hypothetical protein [Enterococcus mundtii]|uniref:Uncharacterized protein n=2 Tax=Enterococcus mundtii TaxID=53346 RepID=A0A1L8V3C7_ENTMU|nr:hypothetical protein [Enterococcus mundtii]GEN17063.1 hypothetical protein LAC02_03440 [Ligilactobacillus acidipiscis]AUB54264.1 hypothetical protein EM4838_15275 [Enterococcus mundtii]AUB54284.1 hypothetical protein EM4838_00005 [Enterococcus mundtii]MZZ58856.1 hypothetical protein [Enterococcus mundtii]MZZ61787.1 hypothetical protein [Enterococcus mundtii]